MCLCQSIHDLYNDNQSFKLSEWIVITAICAWVFTMLVSFERVLLKTKIFIMKDAISFTHPGSPHIYEDNMIIGFLHFMMLQR